MTTIEALKEVLGKRAKIFLMNGFQMKGTIMEVFDDGGLRVEDILAHENIIPANAISTVQT